MKSSTSFQPLWQRYLLSVDFLFFATFLLLGLTKFDSWLFIDSNTLLHIKFGQILWQTAHLPSYEIMSFLQTDQQWIEWEWLFDALVGGLYQLSTSGFLGVKILGLSFIAFYLVSFFLVVLNRSKNLMLSVFLVVMLACFSKEHMLLRPHILSWLYQLFLVLLLYQVDEHLHKDNQSMISSLNHWAVKYCLAFFSLFCLWSNSHPSFILGFLFITIFGQYSFWKSWLNMRQKYPQDDVLSQHFLTVLSKENWTIWLVVGFFSFLGSCLNPYGLRLHQHIFDFITHKKTINNLMEYLPADFHSLLVKMSFLYILVCLMLLICLRASWRDIVLLLYAFFSAGHSQRFLGMNNCLVSVVMAPYLHHFLVGIDKVAWQFFNIPLPIIKKDQKVFKLSMTGNNSMKIPLLSIALLVFCSTTGYAGRTSFQLDKKIFPVEAASFLQKNLLRGRTYTTDSWSGYLFWTLPGFRSFFDGRADFFKEKYAEDYLDILWMRDGWYQKVDEKYDFDLMLIPKAAGLYYAMMYHPHWEMIYEDPLAAVFKKKRSLLNRSSAR